MEIKDNRSDTNVFFKDIASGACFEFEKEFYIKGLGIETNSSGVVLNATNLSDGHITSFEPINKCLLVNGSIIIERN